MPLKSLTRALNSMGALSIRVRLSFLFIVIFGGFTLLFNILIYQFMVQTLRQDFDDALFNYSVDIADGVVVERGGDLNIPPLHLDQGKILPFRLGTALIWIRHRSGQVLERVGPTGQFVPPLDTAVSRIVKGFEYSYETISINEHILESESNNYRLVTVPLDGRKRPRLFLQIAVPMTLLEKQLGQQLNVLFMGIPLVLVVAALGGVLLSSSALRPLQDIIQVMNTIGAHDLSKRVPIAQANDEMKSLALKFNEMLSRIEESFHSQERFVADASHQLMTPLSVMKGELELRLKNLQRVKYPLSAREMREYIGREESIVQLSDPSRVDVLSRMMIESHDSQGAEEELIRSQLQEVEQLSKIVREMLLLSRIDAGKGSLKLEDLHLAELIFEILPRMEKLAVSKNIKLFISLKNPEDIESPAIQGDRDLLQHLFINIIENAIKYSNNSTSIDIEIGWDLDKSYVLISDQAGGISEERLPYIFDRFSRGADVENKVKGNGIGLAIAKKVAELHNAQILVSNKKGGVEFKVEIKNF